MSLGPLVAIIHFAPAFEKVVLFAGWAESMTYPTTQWIVESPPTFGIYGLIG